MKIAFLTLWSGQEFDQLAAVVNPSKAHYCRRHGYDFIALRGLVDANRHPCWNKLLALEQVLPSYDWVLWCDLDTVLWNSHIRLEPFIAAAGDAKAIFQENHEGVNSGIFLARNHPWTFRFLRHCLAMRQFDSGPLYDNAAIREALRAPEVRQQVQLFPTQQPHGGFHGYIYFNDWDKLLIHFAGVEQPRRRILMENLAGLAEYPPELRILDRTQLGDLLNRAGLLGEGVEVGVWRGDFSRQLLQTWRGRKLHLVDAWRSLPDYRDLNHSDDSQHEANYQTAIGNTTEFGERVQIHRGLSTEVARDFHDGSLDFAYIDANHSYEAVLADLRAWFPKVRSGGLFAGHDYLDHDFSHARFGVRRAVNEFAAEHGLHVAATMEPHWPSWYAFVGPTPQGVPQELRHDPKDPEDRGWPSEGDLRACFGEIPRLSRMGGPFVNDFRMALEFDAILRLYDCDAIVETGTHWGETTEYLARAYPDRKIYSCDIAEHLDAVQKRLLQYPNVTVRRQSSPEFLRELPDFRCPLYFLDAHWGRYWPLLDELRAIRRGVVPHLHRQGESPLPLLRLRDGSATRVVGMPFALRARRRDRAVCGRADQGHRPRSDRRRGNGLPSSPANGGRHRAAATGAFCSSTPTPRRQCQVAGCGRDDGPRRTRLALGERPGMCPRR